MIPDQIGRYKIVEKLGSGGTADVYKGIDPLLERYIAVKVIHPQILKNPSIKKRFEREVHTVASLEDVAVVPIYDYGNEGEYPFIVMRLMACGSVSNKLINSPIPFNETIRILSPIAKTLDRVHSKGIIHRDIKPSNILLDQKKNPFLSDFGIAKYSQEYSSMTGNLVIGTPPYMAPEQFIKGRALTSKSDQYSLGITFFQMLTGRLPFNADTPYELLYKHLSEKPPSLSSCGVILPDKCDEIIQKMLAKNPEERFNNLNVLLEELSNVSFVPGKTIKKVIPALRIIQPNKKVDLNIDDSNITPVVNKKQLNINLEDESLKMYPPKKGKANLSQSERDEFNKNETLTDFLDINDQGKTKPEITNYELGSKEEKSFTDINNVESVINENQHLPPFINKPFLNVFQDSNQGKKVEEKENELTIEKSSQKLEDNPLFHLWEKSKPEKLLRNKLVPFWQKNLAKLIIFMEFFIIFIGSILIIVLIGNKFSKSINNFETALMLESPLKPIYCNIENQINPPEIILKDFTAQIEHGTLVAKYKFQNIPDQILFDGDIPKNYTQYEWAMNINIDNDDSTGYDMDYAKGIDYRLGITHYSNEIEAHLGNIKNNVINGVYIYDNKGGFDYISALDFEIVTDGTIIIRAYVPNISETSKIYPTITWKRKVLDCFSYPIFPSKSQ